MTADQNHESDPESSRHVVLHPRTAAARRHGRARSRGGFVRGHPVDEGSLASLIGRQRRQALVTAVLLIIPLFSIPAAIALLPDLAAARPLGVPSLAWILLSPGLFPFFVVLGRWHERRAESIEGEWIETNR